MKFVINQGVRDCIEELARLFDRFDSVCSVLSDPNAPNDIALDAGFEKQAIKDSVAGCSAKLLSHATKGRRYPHMTNYRSVNQW